MRQKKRTTIKFERVESVEVYKLTDRQRIEELCPDGFVYDIEVEDNHNYLANGILAHNCGAIPKPGKYTRMFRDRFGDKPMIFLSGTPHPETILNIFHQLWVLKERNPFKSNSFYRWFDSWGFVKKQFDNGYGLVNNYQNTEEVIYKFWGKEKQKLSKQDPDYQNKLNDILRKQDIDIERQRESTQRLEAFIDPYLVKTTQKDAGFETQINEVLHYVNMNPETYKLMRRLKKDLIIRGKEEVVLADTAAKLMGKLHQMSSGTVIFESGNSMILDTSKLDFIVNNFAHMRMGIFYKFKAEAEMLKQIFGDDITESLPDFDDGKSKHIMGQFLSMREGISLRNADVLIILTPDFSATTYFQARDRLTFKGRKDNNVHWILSDMGIDKDVFKSVMNKKTFTTSVFNRSKFGFENE